jgi:hypothetical protein
VAAGDGEYVARDVRGLVRGEEQLAAATSSAVPSRPSDDIERFAADGVLMKDGSLEKADHIAEQIKAPEIAIIRSEP